MNKALTRFRVVAYIAGVVLLAFCVEIFVKYVLKGPEISWFPQLHGFVYMVYLLVGFDISRRVKLTFMQTIGLLLAGTIPVMSFVADSRIRRRAENLR